MSAGRPHDTITLAERKGVLLVIISKHQGKGTRNVGVPRLTRVVHMLNKRSTLGLSNNNSSAL